MNTKLWFQQGENTFKVVIPADYEDISDLITLIGKDDFVRKQLQIPKDCGTITLFYNEEQLKTTLLLAKVIEKRIGADGEHPIIVKIQTSRVSSATDLFESGAESNRALKRRKNLWKESTVSQLEYDPESALFELPEQYLVDSGIQSEKKILLYCRPTFHELFMFFRERVIDNQVHGWILGPPGTGKSTAALAFASTLDRKDWVITWIHLSRFEYPVCVLFHR